MRGSCNPGTQAAHGSCACMPAASRAVLPASLESDREWGSCMHAHGKLFTFTFTFTRRRLAVLHDGEQCGRVVARSTSRVRCFGSTYVAMWRARRLQRGPLAGVPGVPGSGQALCAQQGQAHLRRGGGQHSGGPVRPHVQAAVARGVPGEGAATCMAPPPTATHRPLYGANAGQHGR